MASITVDVSEVVKKLDPQDLERHLSIALEGAADRCVRDDVRRYPPPSRGPMKWKSAKQRRWFFAALRRGEIEVPYRRGQSPGSERLGASWTKPVARKVGAGLIQAIVGTNVSYARYVQDSGFQAAIHKGNWQTVQDVARRQAQPIKRFIEQSLARWAK